MSNYTFAGIDNLTKEQYDVLKSAKDSGYCPFCGRPLPKNFGNDRKHLKACPSRESFLKSEWGKS
jgi:hypothetical protein